MAKVKTPTSIETRNLNELYDYLRKEIGSYDHLKVEYSDSELSLILDKEIGIGGYEEGIAKPNETSFMIEYSGMRENARKTFFNQRVNNYDIAKRLQSKVNESLKSGKRYRERGCEQLVLIEDEVDAKGVEDFFKFLVGVFKEKSKS
ncbi:hypothetical protein B6U80_00700 [Candidatus Pacearchaeota archaeon ex4484_26]|nr:MAG: hypothetical protein B6U80_00700 [Candidatus Pacearchaeota archaeon ex4484_26]